ncbi:MAG: HAD family hydrolase [Verrucomicrobia bacterium]|nr:HAD family hydrolase [Verrucomicrobiota bacterium]
MLTGDNLRVAGAVARQIGVDHFEAGLLPEQKEDYVRKLPAAGHTVGMIGDGINDAPPSSIM